MRNEFGAIAPLSTCGRIACATIVACRDNELKLLSGAMRWVVFLRAVNVGGANRCQPATVAKQLAKYGVLNVGAVGTFVVQADVNESALRAAISQKLLFKCEIIISPARDVVAVWDKDPFANEPAGVDVTRFVSVMHDSLSKRPALPLSLPSVEDWQLKVVAMQGRFVLGIYRRNMKAISYLGKLEKLLAIPITTRSWTTIEKVVRVIRPVTT